MTDVFHHLHSHSGIEKKLLFPKNIVLVDNMYANMFKEDERKPFVYENVEYCKVPILSFVWHGGVFKNFDK